MFCGYEILPDFGVFDIFKNPNISRALQDYTRHLEKHCLESVREDPAALSRVRQINLQVSEE